jgi:hypothetical protein
MAVLVSAARLVVLLKLVQMIDLRDVIELSTTPIALGGSLRNRLFSTAKQPNPVLAVDQRAGNAEPGPGKRGILSSM